MNSKSENINIYRYLKSPRLWFVIFLLIMIYIFVANDGIKIDDKAEINPNPRADKIYKYKSINNINLITNTGQLYISPIDSRKGRSQNISNLGKTIYIRMYNITDARVIQKLKQLTSDHDIYMIYETLKHSEKTPTEDYQRLVNGLESAGIHIYTDDQMGVNFTHAKTMVGPNGYIIETMNWTKSSFDKNREFIFVGNDSEIRDNLIYIFRKDLSGEKISENEIHPNLLICPIDCRPKIEYMIRSAKTSIYIYNQYINDSNITDLLKEKISAGLDVKIILAKGDQHETNKANFGNSYKGQSTPYPHAKVLLIDDKYLIVTSINFSSNSMNRNREIGTISMDKNAIDKFKKVFEEDWGK